MGINIATKLLSIYIESFWKMEASTGIFKWRQYWNFFFYAGICTDIDFGSQAMLA